MKHCVSAVIAASILILPAVSFAAQEDGPRAMERVVQQNQKYERNHPRQSPTAGSINSERKAADKSAVDPTSNGNSR
ncbi:hypothetical protein M0D69_07035 [Caballeronia sp. SEWSISQ10-4 2]|nr:hypothetical protein [Caballeronia sp. SEWSISQ10-4 2]